MKHHLNSISPIDGRYAKLTQELSTYFSEAGLIKYRVFIEIEYFLQLCKIGIPQLKRIQKKQLENLTKIASEITSDLKEDKKLLKEYEKSIEAMSL